MFGHLKFTVSKVLVLDFDHYIASLNFSWPHPWMVRTNEYHAHYHYWIYSLFSTFSTSLSFFFCGQWFFRAIHQWQYLQNWSKFTPFFSNFWKEETPFQTSCIFCFLSLRIGRSERWSLMANIQAKRSPGRFFVKRRCCLWFFGRVG